MNVSTFVRLPAPGPADRASLVRIFNARGDLIAWVDPADPARRRVPVSAEARLADEYARVLAGCRGDGLTPLEAAHMASLEQRLAAVVPLGRG